MFVERKLAALFSIFVAGWLTLPASAIEVTALAGAAHGYPGLCEANGRKIADGEFRQWVDRKAVCDCAGHKSLADESCAGWLPSLGRPNSIAERSTRASRFAFGCKERTGGTGRRLGALRCSGAIPI
jgi:hypothetical protein